MTAGALVQIAVPFLDSRATQLRWALGLAPMPALAARTVVVDGGPDGATTVELRVLGASHQVLVQVPGRPAFSETVACSLPGAAPLPATQQVAGYRIATAVRRHPGAGLAATVEALVDRLGDDPTALVTRFPGHPHAVTALRALPGPLPAWETWHAYPQAGELVTTTSTLHGAAPGRPDTLAADRRVPDERP